MTARAIVAFGLVLSCLVVIGCGGGSSNFQSPPPATPTPTPPPPTPIPTPTPAIMSVSVSCSSPTVPVTQTNQCSASVQGIGAFNSAVTWAVNSVQGGNTTVGTVSASGLYTAPATVPTPFTVNVIATSITDSTKTASVPVIIAGTIASTTQTVIAATGGTIALPDGSSVTIPAGLLAADQTVTFSERSAPVDQPSSQLLVGTGPVLSLSFSAPLQPPAVSPIASIRSAASPVANAAALAGISFNFNLTVDPALVTNAQAAVARFANETGQFFFQGITSAVDAVHNTAQAIMDASCVAAMNALLAAKPAVTVSVFFVELAARPANAPTAGLRLWNPTAGQWLPLQSCPAPISGKTLVVVHGMLSSVEGSYTEMVASTTFLAQAGYGQVFGINYDWWNGISQNGSVVASHLTTILNCPGIQSVDIMAHSEGVPVSLSALIQPGVNKAAIRHLIVAAGPILGTPIANTFNGSLGVRSRYALLTVVANFPFSQMVFPPASFGGLVSLLNSEFAVDLATDALGSNALSQIRSAWVSDSILSKLPVIMVGGTLSNPVFAGFAIPLGPCLNTCFGLFSNEPFDGVVGLDSALGAGVDLTFYRIPSVPLFHTDIVGNPGALIAIASQLNSVSPPVLQVSSFSPSSSCTSNQRSCSGPPGAVFSFRATGLAPNTAVQMYIQDPTGTQDPPLNLSADGAGAVAWTDPVPCTKAGGTYGVWLYDTVHLVASNSVIETLTNAACIPPVTMSIDPPSATVITGSTQQFTATVTGTTNTAVSWSVQEGLAGGTITPAGLYTAPTVAGPYHVTATSQANPAVSGAASVTVSDLNPAPTVSSLSPSSVLAGSVTQTLNINGTNFLTKSSVTFNGVQHPSTFVNASELTINLSAGDLSVAGNFPVVVTNPAPGGGPSAPFNFVVGNPVPAIAGLSPSSVTVGSPAQPLTISGSNFLSKSIVTVNGVQHTDVFVNSSQLATSLSANELATAGNLAVIVTNPPPGGGPSNSSTFVVNSPVIGPVTVSPSTAQVPQGGAQAFTATVTGGTKGVTWAIAEGTAGGSMINTTNSSAVYLPPNTNGVFHVTATSVDDPTQSATATVSIGPPISLETLFVFPVVLGVSAAEGQDPTGALVQANDGNFYGTAGGGGIFGGFPQANCFNEGCGAVFKIDSLTHFTLLHMFAAADGAFPVGGLVQGADGALYGVTSGGGALQNCVVNGGTVSCGTMFRIDLSGTLTVLHSFGAQDGAFPSAGLILGSDGNFYGTTSAGGNTSCLIGASPQTLGCGTVFRADSTGQITVLHAFSTGEGFLPTGLVQARDGNFYGTTQQGGSTDEGTVFKMDMQGNFTTLHTFVGPEGAFPNGPLIQASDGFLYGTAIAGGGTFNGGTVFRIDSVGTLTTLHSFTGQDGYNPRVGLIQGADGLFYGVTFAGGGVLNAGPGNIFRMDAAGNVTGLHIFTNAEGVSPFAPLIQSTDGRFYGTTLDGGINNGGTVFRFSAPAP